MKIAVHAGFRGLHRIELVVHGRGRTGEVVNLVDLQIQGEGDVVTQQLEAFVVEQMRDIALSATEEIVNAHDLAAAAQQALAQVRPEKTSAASHEDSFLVTNPHKLHSGAS